MEKDHLSRKLAVLLHADVVGSTSLVQKNETLAHERIQDTFRRFSETITNQGGIAHEIRGDALVAEFAKASDAVNASLAFQAVNTTHNEQLSDEIRPVLRIGIALGEVVIADNTVTGEGIVMAQRLEQLAEAGGLCVQGAAYDTMPKRLPFEYVNLGERTLKGIDEPVKVYLVKTQSEQRSVILKKGATGTLPEKPSIAVLPFDNMSGDPDQEYFSDGISEDIITDLSKISGLHVIARNSSFVFKGENVNIKQAATELGARYVLEGSVRKSGDRVRITAQLIDSSSGGHLWAERYDRVLENIFDLQDEIAGNIVNALRVKISLSEERAIENNPTKNVVAYEFCLRGRSLLREMTRGDVELATTMFEKAIAIDPHYVQALAGLADCGSMLQFHYQLSGTEAQKILAYCKLALEIDPNSSEAHASYGRFLSLKTEEHENAAREFQIANELSPESVEAHYYFGLMYLTNDWAEKSVSLMRQAYALAEFDLQAGMMLMTALHGASRHVEEQEIAKQVLRIARIRHQLNPEDEAAIYVGGNALYHLNEIDEAISWSEMATSLVTEDSRQIYNLACLLSLLKRTDQAIDMIARALRLDCSENKINWIRYVDPDLANIRQEARFQDLFS
jgi:adenylate cyclase